MAVRNSAKAIVLNDGKILVNRCISKFGEYYALPGGGQHTGEMLNETVKRELLEETGYISERWTYLGPTIDNPSKLTNRMHLFLAEGCVKVAEQKLDENEHLSVMTVPLQKAVDMVMDGRINANTAAHLILKAEKLLQDLK